ncbi:MAG: response regulator transcription factor [Dehalococcoidales bacterium]|nr:response regulator transcription factor [Dehalococcoidales bacterium]
MNKITVVLADDHEVVRKGLRSILASEEDIEVVGEASNGLELPGIVESNNPRIIIMDFVMPSSGVLLIKKLAYDYPKSGIIVFSFYDDEAYVISSLDAQAQLSSTVHSAGRLCHRIGNCILN